MAPLHGVALEETPTTQSPSRVGKQNDFIAPLLLFELQGPKPSHGEDIWFVTDFKRRWNAYEGLCFLSVALSTSPDRKKYINS